MSVFSALGISKLFGGNTLTEEERADLDARSYDENSCKSRGFGY